jgi:hypothetical protein
LSKSEIIKQLRVLPPTVGTSLFGERGGASLEKRPQAARSWWRRKLTNV